ncbi:tRNA-i(6)A37 thiotransferase enzyme MiaB [Candidatus Omnitrophus magneticus]|uniref:tRNA-2-methylthio-N(6)-dimethylallyladenosine synthase n=1 Tax=Candidatus Omnitrophus magneticus TaxID=1609969 RepID=A0A0F0CJC2_9BACT|nr:tRNA-i(6)A37 thiotransferase enzyme MiaB [Candidatus Omnitrophus magneticus]
MNVRDSGIIEESLKSRGYVFTDNILDADIVIFNTCTVRQNAEDRVLANVKSLSSRKKKNPNFKIAIVGCVAERHGEKILKDFPAIDILAGPNNIYDIPDLIEESFSKNNVYAVGKEKRPSRKEEIDSLPNDDIQSFVNIMYGCDNFCSYCIVPYVRGREVSRPLMDIIDEIKILADKGIKEVTLLGQNVNSYGAGLSGNIDFTNLLEAVNKVAGIERIRFTTSHPKDAGKKLFTAMRDLKKVCPHIHLPLQAGSNRILELMNRKYTFEEYMEKIFLLREFLPDAGVSTDIIVGFPSEREEDFLATREAMKVIKFNSAFIFKYSPRPPASSSVLKDDVPSKIKEARNNELLDLQKKLAYDKNKMFIGSVREVLVEGKSKMNKKELTGRTLENVSCVFPCEENIVGKIVSVKIRDASPFTLKGEIF